MVFCANVVQFYSSEVHLIGLQLLTYFISLFQTCWVKLVQFKITWHLDKYSVQATLINLMTFDMIEYQIESAGVRYLLPMIHLSTSILRKQLLAYLNAYLINIGFHPRRYQINHLFSHFQEYNYYAWDIALGSWIPMHIAQCRLEDLFVEISES